MLYSSTISVIERRATVSNIFKKFDLLEVYARKDFQTSDDCGDFIAVVGKKFKVYPIWNTLIEWFPNGVMFRTVHNYRDPLLQGYKLVWKGEHWYV